MVRYYKNNNIATIKYIPVKSLYKNEIMMVKYVNGRAVSIKAVDFKALKDTINRKIDEAIETIQEHQNKIAVLLAVTAAIVAIKLGFNSLTRKVTVEIPDSGHQIDNSMNIDYQKMLLSYLEKAKNKFSEATTGTEHGKLAKQMVDGLDNLRKFWKDPYGNLTDV